jgi:hypothetical protein
MAFSFAKALIEPDQRSADLAFVVLIPGHPSAGALS